MDHELFNHGGARSVWQSYTERGHKVLLRATPVFTPSASVFNKKSDLFRLFQYQHHFKYRKENIHDEEGGDE